MSRLEDVTYSREATIATIREYYDFLAKMYLDPSLILEPPSGGWAEIPFGFLDKTDEVVSLLRGLPYLNSQRYPQGAPGCTFADWPQENCYLKDGRSTLEDIRCRSEKMEMLDYPATVPSHVVSLTSGNSETPAFLLDTHLGVVYWVECPPEICDANATREQILDDPDDYNEGVDEDWRGSAAWAVADFFEVLKDQFRLLNFYPVPDEGVELVWMHGGEETKGIRETVC